jgi:curli biogenesis system outer membrane secretion channel CsgG
MKKSSFVFALVLTTFTYSCFAAETAAPIAGKKRKVVLVPPFENLSKVKSMVVYEVATSSNPDNPKRLFHVDRYSEAPRAVLEDILQGIDGVTAVERTRVDAILLESEFGRLSGLVDSEKAAKMGKMLGANTIIMGSILDVASTKKSFSGYGIRTDTVVVRSSIRVRIMDIESGNLTLSKIVRGSVSYSSSNFGGVEDSDVAYSVIESTLESLRDDSEFKTAVATGQSGGSGKLTNVEVDFSPIPENSDIEIEGTYVGGSPLKKTLPAGKPVKLRIAKAGYKAWETTITPEDGMRITKELERVNVETPTK